MHAVTQCPTLISPRFACSYPESPIRPPLASSLLRGFASLVWPVELPTRQCAFHFAINCPSFNHRRELSRRYCSRQLVSMVVTERLTMAVGCKLFSCRTSSWNSSSPTSAEVDCRSKRNCRARQQAHRRSQWPTTVSAASSSFLTCLHVHEAFE